MDNDNQNAWIQSAQLLPVLFSHLDKNRPVSLFLRHSHRGPISDPQKSREIPLSELGHQTSFEFGQKLPLSYLYHIFYSPLPRCKDTAFQILQGILKNGGSGRLIAPILALLDVGGDQRIINRILFRDGKQYVNNWCAGLYPPDQIESSLHYSQRVMSIVCDYMKNAQTTDCFIFIGHDVNLLGLRYALSGIPADESWLDYLNGFFVQQNHDQLLISNKDKIISCPCPYWLKV